jgi:Fur family ferric uptake transcriptional regulator
MSVETIPSSGVLSDSVQLLREHGLRVTAQRLAVLDAVKPGLHLDADHVAVQVRAGIGPVATQTIYDALSALTETQLLRSIKGAGAATLYERNMGDHHRHIVCRSCHRIDDIEGVVDPSMFDISSTGYVVDSAEVLFWGLCPECQIKG